MSLATLKLQCVSSGSQSNNSMKAKYSLLLHALFCSLKPPLSYTLVVYGVSADAGFRSLLACETAIATFSSSQYWFEALVREVD